MTVAAIEGGSTVAASTRAAGSARAATPGRQAGEPFRYARPQGGAASPQRAPARQSRPTQAEMGRPGPQGSEGVTGPRGPSGGQGRAAAAPAPERAERRERPERKGKSKRSAAAGRLIGASTKSGSALHNYQAIIAAEYVAATLLVALSPIASGKRGPSATSGTLSPYAPADIIKIFAIGIVYLILEGLAAGPRGLARFAAWFGFLVMLGVGLSELSRIAQVFALLAGSGVSPTKLTGAQAPPVKGTFNIPPLVPGGPAAGTSGSAAGEGGSAAGEGSGGPLASFAGGT